MSVFSGSGTCPLPFNPEFAKAVPTNGFGEIEATVTASLGHPGAPLPGPIPTNLTRKVCRIYSPVSTPRAGYSAVGRLDNIKKRGVMYQRRDAPLRPHTADAVLVRRPSLMTDTTAQARDASGISVPCLHADVAESARLVLVQQRSRPMTSDGSSQRQNLQRRGQSAGRKSGGGIHNDASVGQLRPSTSGGGRRRPPAVSHGGFDTGRVAPTTTTSSDHRTEGNCGQQQEQGKPLKPPNQEERFPLEETQRRPQTFAGPRKNDVKRFVLRPAQNGVDRRTRDIGTPPNKYWPSPGGAKEFLRPFIERNQRRLWAYDPELVGLNHVEAYHHLVSKGNFEAVKRTLLEKEDALTRGTGSFLMADTIERFRGESARRSATEEHPERTRGLSQRPVLEKTVSRRRRVTATESDSFQSGSCNADKLRRERARRQDMLLHAKTRNNVFFRRKGYEPGDFLKHRAVPSAGGGLSSTNGGGRELSARSAAAAAAAAEFRRKAYRRREEGERGRHVK